LSYYKRIRWNAGRQLQLWIEVADCLSPSTVCVEFRANRCIDDMAAMMGHVILSGLDSISVLGCF